MSSEQRFCPLCNRVFTPGEAVLRCDGCGVLHHPGCWVTNNGCSTEREHQSFPVAQAYGADPGPSGRSPSTGQRVRPAPIRPQREAALRHDDTDDVDDDEAPAHVIGAGNPIDPLPRVRRGPPAPDSMRPRAPRRYDDGGASGPRTLPKVYGRRRVIDFWYIPAAIIVAAIVAVGVIIGVEQLTGSSDNDNLPAAGASNTATASTTAIAGASGTAPASATASVPPAGTPGATGGAFTVGQALTVTGTGDCLNVRTGPSTSDDAIVCVKDGVTVTVTGGPQDAEGYTWWKIQTDQGEGWAAGDYLAASSAG